MFAALIAGAFLLLLAAAPGSCGEGKGDKPKFIGFVDRDRDGRNDLFRDENGDGINDVTGKPYPHRFKFEDKNGDKINDIFVDSDGDGVNDRGTKFVDRDRDGLNDNVIDYNRDGVNDITGLKYGRDSLNGYRFGFVDEEHGIHHRKFIDEDGDGMHDGYRSGRLRDSRFDYFIDRDGDGICDGRGFRRRWGHRGAGGHTGGGTGRGRK